MKINDTRYIKSAPSLKDVPDLEGAMEVAMVGRSNVGKSSFINSLLLRKNLARTSNTPGKTRLINFYEVDFGDESIGQTRRKIILVDLPGYGFAKVSKTEQEQWRRNLEAYLTQRDSLRLVVQLVDIRHEPQASDLQMNQWLLHQEIPHLVVLTKADKLSRNEAVKQVQKSPKLLGLEPQGIVAYSAENHQGRDTIWEILQGLD